ncbi:ubiquitin carboxyl-terminal hydrolase 15-like isoform X2 [Apostichopus japonicus]|uniref:ubiquitin carboxyl-terminal hydrolase 15-like isoform X2 n=1 Tax=Stichopus japonicus TaxID=307972 RepID=UPI003AB762F4
MAEGGPPEISEQKKQITPLLQKTLIKGETWYLVDSKWFKQWKKYVGYDSWDAYNAGHEESHPGPIDNSGILKEGDLSQLKDHLIDELDYVLLPKEGWEKVSSWYGTTTRQDPVARKVVEHGMFVKRCKVEVYLMEFKLCENSQLDHIVTSKFSKGDTIDTIEKKMREMFEISEDKETRLWNKYMSNSYEPLHQKTKTVQDAELYQGQLLVIEQKNADGSWTRQLPTTYTRSSSKYITNGSGKSSYGYGSTYATRGGSGSAYNHNNYSGGPKVQPGLCGLSNLGNTCFMNSALQCMSNVPLLTKYFLNDEYKDELNLDNPLGMNGEIAKSYAELLKHMWSGMYGYTIPRNFKMQVGRFAPQFSGFQQQDSQELLAFLLDGLHEDLNRIIKKPYIELKDSDGRADEIVAAESWENHLKRNHSIIVDLFHGQFKSKLVCPTCSKVSVTFDPFCFLSLPLPVKKERLMEVFFVRLDGESRPLQMKVVVKKPGRILDLCKAVSKITHVPADNLVVTDVYNHRFHKVYLGNEPLNHITDRDTIYLFEVNVTSADDPETIVLPIYHREPRQSSFSSSTNYHLFGSPMIIPVSRKKTTYQDLYETALKKMSWFVSHPENDDWFYEAEEEEEENPSELQNGESKMKSDSSDEEDDKEKEEVEKETIPPLKEKEKPRMFNLTVVNPYGSSEVHKLRDDGTPLKLTNRTYVSLDWNLRAKEKFFNEATSEELDKDESVNLKNNSKKQAINLSECLKLFLLEETLDKEDSWYCPSCEEHKEATKKFDLWKLPKVLVIHLKRFSCNRYSRDKLDTFVTYPLTDLNMTEYLAGTKGDHDYKYDLVAVVNHYGGLGGGHYTAYANNAPRNEWYYFDDSSVSAASTDQVLSKAAYVLFYIRQDCLKDFSQNGLATLAKSEDMEDENSKNSESDDEDMETN